MQTFPRILTAEEEKNCLQRYQQGDQEAKRILIEHNLRLVAHIVKKYQNTEEDTQDLISIGTIGLMKAVATFDFNKNNRLAAYAARCIDNELLMLLRNKKKSRKEISIYEQIGVDQEGRELCLVDILESQQPDIVEQIEVKEKINRLRGLIRKTLTQREWTVISYRYGLNGKEEMTQKKIAGHLGISRSYVSRIEKNALLKLRIALERNL